MLVFDREGIRFVLVQTRFRSFDGMTKTVQAALEKNKGMPTVVVFPEAARGLDPVLRSETKEWIRKTQKLAKEHGNAHIFLSVIEKAPLKKTFTNTGYLIGPQAKNPEAAKPVQWQAYPKISATKLEKHIMEKQPDIENAKSHWTRRSARLADSETYREKEELSFSFPRTIINGKKIELRVCFDSGLLNNEPAHIMVVPAKRLPVAREDIVRLNRSLKRRGFAIVNDASKTEGKKAFLIKRGGRIEHLRRK